MSHISIFSSAVDCSVFSLYMWFLFHLSLSLSLGSSCPAQSKQRKRERKEHLAEKKEPVFLCCRGSLTKTTFELSAPEFKQWIKYLETALGVLNTYGGTVIKSKCNYFAIRDFQFSKNIRIFIVPIWSTTCPLSIKICISLRTVKG